MGPTAPPVLETPRLRLERIGPQHRSFLVRLHASPELARTLWPGALGGPRSDEQVDAFLQAAVLEWRREGCGHFVVVDRATGAPLGRVALKPYVLQGQRTWELGCATDPHEWGRGVATEAAGALLPVAFDHLGLDHVVAFTLPHNSASRRVMEKLGFLLVGELVHADLPHVLYRLDAPGPDQGGGRPP